MKSCFILGSFYSQMNFVCVIWPWFCWRLQRFICVNQRHFRWLYLQNAPAFKDELSCVYNKNVWISYVQIFKWNLSCHVAKRFKPNIVRFEYLWGEKTQDIPWKWKVEGFYYVAGLPDWYLIDTWIFSWWLQPLRRGFATSSTFEEADICKGFSWSNNLDLISSAGSSVRAFKGILNEVLILLIKSPR